MSTRPAIPSPRPGNLDQYVGDGRCEPGQAFHEYLAVCEALGSTAAPAVIAVDGPTNSGKTTFARALADFCAERGVRVTRLPLDFFLTDRGTRNDVFRSVAGGGLDIADYSGAAWEQDRYRSYLEIVRTVLTSAPEERTLTIPNTYDRQTGKKEGHEELEVHPGGIVVTEGVGLHAYHDDLFDAMIRVDVQDDDMLLQRVLRRERQKEPGARLDEDYLRWRYNTIDRPHTVYLRDVSAGRADSIIDTSDLGNVVLYTKREF